MNIAQNLNNIWKYEACKAKTLHIRAIIRKVNK